MALTVQPSSRLDFAMPQDSDLMPVSRLVRWAAVALLIGIAVAFYFRDGQHIPTLDAGAPAAQSE